MRLLPFIFFASLLGGVASCSSCSHKSSGADESTPIVLSPAPVPDGLLAEMTIANPDFFWGHLQRGVGGLTALMPQSLGGLVTSFASVDPPAATTIDGASPAYAAFVAQGANDFGWAIAVTLTDLPHARAALIDGATAKYDGKDDGIWTILTRKGTPSVAPGPQIAISKNGMLVVADNAADVKSIGEYLVRTMPTHPRQSSDVAIDVPRAALAGPLHDRLLAAWTNFKNEKEAQANEAKQAHGRAADFGDPSGILALADSMIQKRLTFMADLQNTHIAIDGDATSLTIDATLSPNDGNGIAAHSVATMKTGDAAPLLDAFSGPLTILSRSSDADRAAFPADAVAALKNALGDHFTDADTKLVTAAATDWSTAAGDYVLLDVTTDGIPGALITTPTAHADVATKSAHETFELLDHPAFRAPLASSFKVTGSSFALADVAGGGHAGTYTLKRGTGTPLSAAWLVRDGVFEIGASPDASGFLAAQAHPQRAWRTDPSVGARVSALGSTVAFAVVSHPFPSSDPNAAVVMAWGRDGSRAHLSTVASDVVIREAIRLLGH